MNIFSLLRGRARLAAALLFAVLCLCRADAAQAHRVNIFAWLEGDTVVTECSFRRNSPVRGGTVIVLDDVDGGELLRGTTDDDGRFAFPVPQAVRNGHGLRIRINAGEGHQNEWRMEAAEFAGISPAAGFASPPTPAPATTTTGAGAPSRTDAPATQPLPLTREELTAVVNAALERQLGPIRRELAARGQEGPRLQDIVGGLGWIMGLAGMGLYFARRRP